MPIHSSGQTVNCPYCCVLLGGFLPLAFMILVSGFPIFIWLFLYQQILNEPPIKVLI